jgi:TonB family protein
MKVFVFLTGFLLFVSASSAVLGQQALKDQALDLYRKGDDQGAISAFEKLVKQREFENDAEAWNTLGLAYLNTKARKKARKALERAVLFKPESSIYHANLSYAYLLGRQLEKSQREVNKALELDPVNPFANYIVAVRNYWEGELDEASAAIEKILSVTPGFAAAYLLKSEVLMSKFGKRLAVNFKIRAELDLLRQSVEALETGQKNSKSESDRQLIAERLESMRWFFDYYNTTKEPIPPASSTPGASTAPGVGSGAAPGTKPLKILYQPKASYTEDGRIAGAEGAVRLVIHLGANGKVLHVLKLWGIGYGLDEEAIKAAKAIRFEPKMVSGKPISVVIIREYTFDIY